MIPWYLRYCSIKHGMVYQWCFSITNYSVIKSLTKETSSLV